VEIVFPSVIVVADFPLTIDTVAVLAEATGEALAKIQRREVGRVSVELPRCPQGESSKRDEQFLDRQSSAA
jgi:c-di-GMP-binding flagellar brake protein YcgR